MSIKIRTPYSYEEIAKRSKMRVERVKVLCDELTKIGFLEYEGDKINMPVFAPGSMENMVMIPGLMEEHTEIAYAFSDYVSNLTKNFAKYFPMGKGLVITLPVQKAINAEQKKIDIEEVDYWIDKYAPSISLARCQCRQSAVVRGEIGADMEGEWCLQLGEYAESCIRTGRARRVTVKEAYEVIQKAEDMGYVHEVTNIDGPKNSLFICNCHPDTCLAFRTARLVDTPNLMKSNFVASVDSDKCVACGQCMEVCPMNAAKLGEKLCQKDPVKIKKNISTDDHVWGKDKWNLDYRTNKVDVIPETGTSPCKTNCPAHISVQAYLNLAAQGRYMDALEMIKLENPFPAVCGRICNRRCEQACTLGTIDQPVAIDEIKKFIADQEINAEKRFVPKKKFQNGKRIAVIGAGPAGLSCAYYLAVLGHKVTVFEKENKPGGMLRFGIPSFRLEKNVIDAEIEVLKELGVEITFNTEIGKEITIPTLRKEGYKGFYVAIGSQGGRLTGIEGEDAENVQTGIDFLRKVNNGDKTELAGRTVVVGGGNVAIDVARTAVRKGSTEVSMFCLESREEMPAAIDEIYEAGKENIEIVNGWGPKRILVENGKVSGIEFKRCIQVFDKDHKFNPEYDENDVKVVSCEHVLLSIGQSIMWGDLLKGTKVELNRNLTAMADGFTYQTAEEDIFVGGDVYSGPRFAIDAIAAGKCGADSLHRFVHEGHNLLIGRDHRTYKEIDKDNILIESFDRPLRQVANINKQNKKTFQDERETFTEEQVKAETSRCLGCGAAVVDQTRCIGCGLCTTRCKFEAISLSKVSSNYGCTYEQLPLQLGGAIVKRAGKIVTRSVKDALTGDKER